MGTNETLNVIQPAIGSILAWESQAAGSWKTKIGRVVRLPHPGADKRTSESKIRLEILATYHTVILDGRIWILSDKEAAPRIPKLGIKTFQARPMKPLKIGLASPNQVRIPQAWELKLVEGM